MGNVAGEGARLTVGESIMPGLVEARGVTDELVQYEQTDCRGGVNDAAPHLHGLPAADDGDAADLLGEGHAVVRLPRRRADRLVVKRQVPKQ